jgi:Flp pilus assembly protein TadB
MSKNTKTILTLLAVVIGAIVVISIVHWVWVHIVAILVVVALGYGAVHYFRRRALASSERRTLP